MSFHKLPRAPAFVVQFSLFAILDSHNEFFALYYIFKVIKIFMAGQPGVFIIYSFSFSPMAYYITTGFKSLSACNKKALNSYGRLQTETRSLLFMLKIKHCFSHLQLREEKLKAKR